MKINRIRPLRALPDSVEAVQGENQDLCLEFRGELAMVTALFVDGDGSLRPKIQPLRNS